MSSQPFDEPESASATAAQGRRAVLALVVAAIGTVAFAIGLQKALRRLPPEGAASAARAVDSTRSPRFAPPPPNQPDEYPRLR